MDLQVISTGIKILLGFIGLRQSSPRDRRALVVTETSMMLVISTQPARSREAGRSIAAIKSQEDLDPRANDLQIHQIAKNVEDENAAAIFGSKLWWKAMESRTALDYFGMSPSYSITPRQSGNTLLARSLIAEKGHRRAR